MSPVITANVLHGVCGPQTENPLCNFFLYHDRKSQLQRSFTRVNRCNSLTEGNVESANYTIRHSKYQASCRY